MCAGSGSPQQFAVASDVSVSILNVVVVVVVVVVANIHTYILSHMQAHTYLYVHTPRTRTCTHTYIIYVQMHDPGGEEGRERGGKSSVIKAFTKAWGRK